MSLRALFASQLTDSDPEARDVLGAIREDGDGKRYKYVKFTIATNAGNAARYVQSADYDANEVGANNVSPATIAGVAVVDHLVNYYGWIQVAGKATLVPTPTGTAADGGALVSDAATGGLKLAVGATTERPCGVMLDAAAPTIALLDCPE